MNEELRNRIGEASAGLVYMSETDAEITPFEGGPADAVTAANLLAQAGAAGDAAVEERDFEQVFSRLTRTYEGDDEQNARAGRFEVLKAAMTENLRDVKVFAVGRVQVDIYMVGLDGEGNLSGVKTRAVET